VSGYDDIDVTHLCRPSFTTIRQPITELAYGAIDLLLALLEDPHRAPTRVLLPTELIVRASTHPVTANSPARTAAPGPSARQSI
jgi:DNA-binding LacI/PurR family transcriptional regulator